MEAFSYHHYQPIPLDSAHNPFSSEQFEDMSHGSSSFLYDHKTDAIPESSGTEAKTYESNSSLNSARKAVAAENQMDCSSSVGVEPYVCGEVSTPQVSMEKKRKNKGRSCLASAQSKKRSSGDGLKQAETKKHKADEKKACEEPPVGYIHVRARRGQATDSHSLAERVRREKISERMKLLQALVPGCDKVTGKALMLDEIINYVQSLQNQVEFLSMKLASMNPVLYDFGLDFDEQMNQLEKSGTFPQDSQLVLSAHQTSSFHPSAHVGTTRNYSIVDSSSPPPFLLHEQGPIAFPQDNGSFLMQVGEQRQGFLHQVLFNRKSSFQ